MPAFRICPPPRPLDRPTHRPGASEAALALRRNPHTDAHVRLAHTAATEPTPSASRRSAPHAQTPPLLPPHPCPRRPAPLTRRTPRLYQRAYRRRNTQHSRIYDELGLAPTTLPT